MDDLTLTKTATPGELHNGYLIAAFDAWAAS